MASASFPSCRPEFNWMLSSDGWNPCRLATPLIANCDNRAGPLPAINSGEHYQAPTAFSQSPCVCSNVVYALISACALCQNGNTYTWKDWTEKCVQSFPIGYPRSTDGLNIPAWANFNGLYQSQFDIVRASVYANAVPNTQSPIVSTMMVPNSPAVPPVVTLTQVVTASMTVQTTPGTQTTVDTTSNSGPASVPTSSNPTVTNVKVMSLATTSTAATFGTDKKAPISSASGSGVQVQFTQTPAVSLDGEASKGSNKGAIAGGVIGGLLFLAILAGIVFWWLKRRQQSRVAPSAAYIAAYSAPQRTPSMSQSPFQDQATSPVINTPYVSPFGDEKRAYNFSDQNTTQRAPSPTLM